jgi:hypothetical protein
MLSNRREFSFFQALRILGLKSLQPVNHLSNWTWKWRLAVCVQPLTDQKLKDAVGT